MQNLRKWGAWLGAGAVLFTFAGCADKDNSGQAESPATAEQVPGAVADNFGDTANAATGAVKGAGNAVAGAAEGAAGAVAGAGNAIAGGAENVVAGAGNAVAGAGKAVTGLAAATTVTPKIKSAILANAAFKNSTTINVDTLPAKDSVALRGSVKNAAQKNLAEAIAKKNSQGYKIINQLKVAS